MGDAKDNEVPGLTPADYVNLVDSRFTNAEIIDTVRRVAFDGSSRQTGFILPTLRDALACGTPTFGLSLIWSDGLDAALTKNLKG